MEDTLVESKASYAGAMATQKKVQQALDESLIRAKQWSEKAQLAMNKGREDFAREELMEKRRYGERPDALEKEPSQCDALVEQYQSDIMLLEEKLNTACEKQRILAQHHIHTKRNKRAQEEIRRIDSSDTLIRFEQFENRIGRMEAKADLVNFDRKPTLEEEFTGFEGEEEI